MITEQELRDELEEALTQMDKLDFLDACNYAMGSAYIEEEVEWEDT